MLKNIFIILVFLSTTGIFAQNIKQINTDLKLTDSLSYNREIRVYQDQGITNYTSVFRIYKDSIEWKVEFFEHFAKVRPQDTLKIKKRDLKSKNDKEFVFENLIRSYALELPDMERIEWKLESRKEVIKQIDTSRRGEISIFYWTPISKMSTTDGESFFVQVKTYNGTNTFSYGNPDLYLKRYPNVDELIYMCEILDIIRTEFNIWKKED